MPPHDPAAIERNTPVARLTPTGGATRRLLTGLLLASMVSLLAACGALKGSLSGDGRPGADSAEALRQLQTLQALNASLMTYKGIGRLEVKTTDGTHKLRVAWIGAAPGKLRIEVLGLAGHPMASLAWDGDWTYLRTPPQGKVYKQATGRFNLGKLISIPISPQDIFFLLAGRLPLDGIAGAQPFSAVGAQGRQTLTLRSRWRRFPCSRVSWQGKGLPESYTIERYDRQGMLRYRAELGAFQPKDAHRIPMEVTLTAPGGRSVHIAVERYWTNPVVDAAAFTLAAPEA